MHNRLGPVAALSASEHAGPLISIITVCRNSSATIQRTFDAVLQQTYPNIDYVVVDGASTDGTLDIIRMHRDIFRSKGIRFQWISEPDRGIYDAMNKGLRLTQGDVIGILNSDDYYEPHTCHIVADFASKDLEIGIFYGFLRVVHDGQEFMTYRYRYEHYLLDLQKGVYSATQHPTCFVRRDVYDQIGLFDEQFRVAADYDFLIRAMRAGIRFYGLDAVLSNFSSGGTSDQWSDYERHQQRWAIWHKNGLLTDDEYQQKQRSLRYKRYKQIRQKVGKWLFRL